MNKQCRLIGIFLIVVTAAVSVCACEQSSSEQDLNGLEAEAFVASIWNDTELPTQIPPQQSVDVGVSSRKRCEQVEPTSLKLFKKMKRVRTCISDDNAPERKLVPNDDTIFAQSALQSITEDQASIETIKNLFERVPKLEFKSNFSLVATASEIVKWAERDADTRWPKLNELSDYGKKIICSYLLSFYYCGSPLRSTFNKKGDFKVLGQDLISNWKLITCAHGNKNVNISQVLANLTLPARLSFFTTYRL